MWNKPINDLTGMKFMSLTVTGEYKKIQSYKKNGKLGGNKVLWKCVCDCGNVLYEYAEALRRRKVDYCVKCRPTGVRNSRLYHIYHGIKQRCYNEKAPGYENYGGRGIRMSDEWLESYEVFRDWSLENGYKERAGLSIDRIDNDGNYCKENCQWITVSENTAKGDRGKVRSHSWMTDMYAISPDGDRIDITNITDFSRSTGLNLSCVGACLRGYTKNTYKGWIFHSNRSRKSEESVTTIESTSCEKDA